jgi:hypothetical protein
MAVIRLMKVDGYIQDQNGRHQADEGFFSQNQDGYIQDQNGSRWL